MTNRTLRTQRIAKPALRLQSSDLFLTRQGADTEDAVALMSDLTAFNGPHPRYHFHGYAGDQIVGDGKFFDRTALGNHGVRGANLSDAQLFANAGYVSTIDPAGGATDSVIRLPNLNFNYDGGEKLIIWWLGKITAEGSSQEWMGDGSSATYPGLALRLNTNGTIQPYIRSAAASYFGSSTSSNVGNGTLQSWALAIDGTGKQYAQWVNDALDGAWVGGFLSWNGGNPSDSRNANTFNIGCAVPAVGVSTNGTAVQTRALAILRLSATDVMPTAATLTNTFKQLRANPSKPILGSAF